MTLSERINLLSLLGAYLQEPADDALQAAMHKAWAENKWFATDHVVEALRVISKQMLDKQKLTDWAAHYGLQENGMVEKVIGIVMAGNIPLVGFSDWLAVFVAGQRAVVKLSDKDKVLLPFLVHWMGQLAPQSRAYTHFLGEHEPLRDYDAVIATGSNNTARYFEQYFAKHPHIIRHNRTSVAVLAGHEAPEQLTGLASDIYDYFGLGCRNVSKLYLPVGSDMQALCEALDVRPEFAHHDKYRNNYDYNTTLFILNKIPYYATRSLILREDESLHSRISCVHIEFYTELKSVEQSLLAIKDQLQCVATQIALDRDLPVVPLGQTQSPGLMDYPDGVDVMEWIKKTKVLA